MSSTPQLQTVDHVDLNRYLGTWYEICRLPLKYEDTGASDVTATYQLNKDGSVSVDNRCIDDDGKPSQALGQAKPVDDSNARLSVTFLPEYLRWIPFTTGDYWIIRLAPDYSISLVGTPDRKHLWVLARRHDLSQEVQNDYLATACAQGFDLSALIIPRQSGNMVELPDAE